MSERQEQLQDIFDRAVSAVIEQGRSSSNEFGDCLYRGPNGARCAVGWLIPDYLYDPAMEHQNVTELLVEWPGALDFEVDASTLELLERLQDAHDLSARTSGGDADDFLKSFTKICHQVARDHDLDPSVVVAG